MKGFLVTVSGALAASLVGSSICSAAGGNTSDFLGEGSIGNNKNVANDAGTVNGVYGKRTDVSKDGLNKSKSIKAKETLPVKLEKKKGFWDNIKSYLPDSGFIGNAISIGVTAVVGTALAFILMADNKGFSVSSVKLGLMEKEATASYVFGAAALGGVALHYASKFSKYFLSDDSHLNVSNSNSNNSSTENSSNSGAEGTNDSSIENSDYNKPK